MPKIRSITKARWREPIKPVQFTYQRFKNSQGELVPDAFVFLNYGSQMFTGPMFCTQEEALRLVKRLNEIAPRYLNTVGEKSIATWCKQVDERRLNEQISKESSEEPAESKKRSKHGKKVAKGSAVRGRTVSGAVPAVVGD